MSDATGGGWRLQLLDSWRLFQGGAEIVMRRREQRLIALLAVQGNRPRSYLAGILWPESTEAHAAGNLRAAVWQVDRAAAGLLMHDRAGLGLHADVHVDVSEQVRWAGEVCGWDRQGTQLDGADCLTAMSVLLRGELLPGWYDDWVSYERSRLQQFRFQGLESLADLLAAGGEQSAALVAATAAVAIEPLRESAQRALIRTQLRAGNYHDALQGYQAFRARLMAELGVAPSSRMDALMGPLLDRQRTRAPRQRVQAVLA